MENMLEIIGILLKVKGQLEALAHDQSSLAGLVSQCEDAIEQLEEADHACRKYMLTAVQYKGKAEAYQQMAELLTSNLSTLASPVYQNTCRCSCHSDDTATTEEGAYDE